MLHRTMRSILVGFAEVKNYLLRRSISTLFASRPLARGRDTGGP
jgi:hypothetical protein